jgi:hypothetical protein
VNLADCRSANGYCVDDSNHVLDQDSMPNASLGRVTGCARDQGIWPGKADIYDQALEGQEILLTNVCNGNYYLVSYTDPNNNVLEMNDSNNVAYTTITLSRQPRPVMPSITLGNISRTGIAVEAVIPSGLRFEWDFGDGSTDTTNNPAVHDYAAPGLYSVRLKIFFQCGVQVNTQTALITASRSLVAPSEFHLDVVPNPASKGQFTIQYRNPTAKPATLTLQDLAGRTVRTFTDEGQMGKHSLPVEASELPAGVYLLGLKTDVGSATVRVLLQ